MRGRIPGAVWSQYQQEPQPGAPDYLTLPARPRLDMLGDMLGLVPFFWLEAERLPHLLRSFCSQHLVTGLLLNWSQGSWFLDMASHHWQATLFCLLILCPPDSDHLSQNLDNTGVDQYSLAPGLRLLERTSMQKVPFMGHQIWGRSKELGIIGKKWRTPAKMSTTSGGCTSQSGACSLQRRGANGLILFGHLKPYGK